MEVHDSLAYKRAKKKVVKLHHLLTELDKVGEILYNNLEHHGVWRLIELLEEVRIYYYVQYYENDNIVKNKGRVDVKD